jgi:hypothetical protein
MEEKRRKRASDMSYSSSLLRLLLLRLGQHKLGHTRAMHAHTEERRQNAWLR